MAQNLDAQTSRLEYQALHDSLTGLPNRQYLFNQLDKLQKSPIEKIEGFSLLLLDLDRFKEVNDSLGHKYGDILLKQLRPRLLETMVKDDLLARLGGDEFAILISTPRPIDEVVGFVRRIRRVIQEPFEIEGIRIQIDVSVGIAQFPEHGKDGSTLLRHADIAMYQAKHHGQGWALYDQKQDVNSPKRLALMSGLRNAITQNELVLYYQPKINIEDRSVRSMEALIRWQHPDLGLLPPEQFIPIGELGKLINPLTIWVLDKAIADCKHWHNLGYHLTVAINVSVLNIQDFELVNKIKVLLGKHDFEVKYL
jgi:diguanylate cyclase (GGDEF)-like protein